MREVFVVTSYYPPEIGAAANRIQHLAEGLKKRGVNVTVISPLPNYPTGRIFKPYKKKLIDRTTLNGVKVVRLWIYASNSKNKLVRLLSMLSYSFSLFWFYLFTKTPKSVIVQCPPLLVAFTSVMLLRSRKRQLILNVSDLWPLAGIELGALKEGAFVNFLRKIEIFNYKKADVILGQSEEILEHISRVVPNKKTLLYRNYPVINDRLITYEVSSPNQKIQLFYAGLLGVAQGIYDVLKNLDYSRIEFHIYGDGAEKDIIEKFLTTNPKLPIYYHGKVTRKELHHKIIKHNLAFIPLKTRIYGSVPSKIFEYAVLGLPILYFGGGEGEHIVMENKLGYVVSVGDFNQLNNVINKLNISEFDDYSKQKIKTTAKKNFRLDSQLDALTHIIRH